MLGAVVGDIIGSRFEHDPHKSKDFELFHAECRFTDDTVLSLAVADSLLQGRGFADSIRSFARAYPDAGYGYRFREWFRTETASPYQSWGNGSAMRVAAVGWWFDEVETVLEQAHRSAAVTHDHPDGIAGAQAVAVAILLARKGLGKEMIRDDLSRRFGYDLGRSLDSIRPDYRFDVSCAGLVPEALIAFFESTGIEDAIRNAVSLGGDADTQACIAGAVAEAFYGELSNSLIEPCLALLDERLRGVLERFRSCVAVRRAAPGCSNRTII